MANTKPAFRKKVFKNFLRNYRSSRPEVFCKKGVLRNFAKFTGKHLSQGLCFNKVARLWPKNTFSYRTPPMAASKKLEKNYVEKKFFHNHFPATDRS